MGQSTLEKLNVDVEKFPLYLSSRDDWYLFSVDPARSISAGLTLRPLAATVRDTFEWIREVWYAGFHTTLLQGLTREVEAELLSLLRKQPEGMNFQRERAELLEESPPPDDHRQEILRPACLLISNCNVMREKDLDEALMDAEVMEIPIENAITMSGKAAPAALQTALRREKMVQKGEITIEQAVAEENCVWLDTKTCRWKRHWNRCAPLRPASSLHRYRPWKARSANCS